MEVAATDPIDYDSNENLISDEEEYDVYVGQKSGEGDNRPRFGGYSVRPPRGGFTPVRKDRGCSSENLN